MSPTARPVRLAYLRSQPFDVLVVGGGIVGAGIARDAAMRGLKVALIEQGDFASGTSSKTSKLIHGGLRYLEQGNISLVRESLRERQILRTIAPSVVHPLSLMLPVYQGGSRPVWQIRAGLWLYDLLAWGRNVPVGAAGGASRRAHTMVSAQRALALEPSLRVDGLRAAGIYADCQMDDARVCLVNILQAISFGAVCANYVRLKGFLTAGGRICGGAVEDALTGRTLEIQAKVVVNATGPWTDGVRRFSVPDAEQRLQPTKGIHVLLPRVALQALFAQARADRRMFFILPWGEYSLVGTTEGRVEGSPDALSATADEVGYLLEEVNRLLPGSRMGQGDVVATFAGARPLLAFAGSATRASREHRIEVDDRGLVSIMGGKFTTYRLMAQQAVNLILRQQRWKTEPCLTDQISLLETPQPITLEHWQMVTRSMDPDLLAMLITRYGAGAFHILRVLDHEPALARPVCPHHEYLEVELVHAVQHELACTITDVLARRTRIAWSSCQGLDLLSTVTRVFERYKGFSREEIARQVDDYQQFLAQGLAFRPVPTAERQWAGAQESSDG